LFSYNNVFDKKIDLNGDNVNYYILGQALEQGKGFSDIHRSNERAHTHFPPGYPAIIAVTSKLFSSDIPFIKKTNGFFLLASVMLLFLIVYQITQNVHLSFIVALFTILNYNLLHYSVIMMSEIPFLFFTLLSLHVLTKVNFQKTLSKNYLFFLAILLVAASYYIRSMGLALFASIALYLLVKRYWQYLITFVAGFTALIIPWTIRSKSLGGSSYIGQLIRKNPYRSELGNMELMDWPVRFWNNFERYVTREIPSGVFNYIGAPNYKTEITSSEWIIGLLILAVMLFGLFRLKKFRLLITLYFTCSFGILLLWPDAWFGIRFSLPLVPLFLLTFLTGMYELVIMVLTITKTLPSSPVITLSPLIFLFAIPSFAEPNKKLEEFTEKPYDARYQNYFDVAKWAKLNTPEKAVISCRKDQLFYVFSNRYSIGYGNSLDAEKFIEDLVAKQVDYVVVDQLGYSSTGRYLVPVVQKYNAKFKVVYQLKNPDTYLLKFNPGIGYFGEFKDNKRNGQGKFIFETGQVYQGEWKDGMRSGIGTFTLADGRYYVGTWSLDKMNGDFEFYNADGSLIQQMRYENNRIVQ